MGRVQKAKAAKAHHHVKHHVMKKKHHVKKAVKKHPVKKHKIKKHHVVKKHHEVQDFQEEEHFGAQDFAQSLLGSIGHHHKKAHKKMHKKKHKAHKKHEESILGGLHLPHEDRDDIVEEQDEDDFMESALPHAEHKHHAKSLSGIASSMLEESDAADQESQAKEAKAEAKKKKAAEKKKRFEEQQEKTIGGPLVHLDLSADEPVEEEDTSEKDIPSLDSFMDDLGDDDMLIQLPVDVDEY